MQKHPTYRPFLAALMLLVMAACTHRRELYVYGDEFYSVTLDVDWRDLDDGTDPDGMTVWFWDLDRPDQPPYRSTTANVRHHDLYLPNGRYQGVVVNYSPEEYSRQAFYDMNSVNQARVVATPANYQPDELHAPGALVTAADDQRIRDHLYGPDAWIIATRATRSVCSSTTAAPATRAATYRTVSSQPEDMGADTIDNRPINSGTQFGDYIPWKERDDYQTSIQVQRLQALPHTLVWIFRVRVFIADGFNYLWQTRASICGLSDGHFLPRHQNTENPCILTLDSWSTERTGPNQGWIACTFTTFGLRPSTINPYWRFHPSYETGRSLYDGSECDLLGYYTDVCDPEDLRLNLAFILRDQATVSTYRFDVGNAVLSYGNQLVLRVELGTDFFGPGGPDPIILPEVDAYEGTDFGADVDPWIDQPPVDVPM